MKLICLSDEFYQTYSNCPEIMQKPTRPYACLQVKIDGNVFAIPFRHGINHKYSFLTGEHSGIDYSKAVILRRRSYIANFSPQIEQKEYNALKGKEAAIYNGMRSFVKLYKKACRYPDSPHYANILRCSTLQYFKEYL